MKRILLCICLLVGIAGVVIAREPFSRPGLYIVDQGEIHVYDEGTQLGPEPPPVNSQNLPPAYHPFIPEPPSRASLKPSAGSFAGTLPDLDLRSAVNPLHVVFPEKLVSGKFQAGSELTLRVGSPIKDQTGRILVQKNAQIFATLESSRPKDILCQRGVLKIRLNHTRGRYGEKVPLAYAFAKHGGGNRGVTLAGAILVAWPLFFLQGSNAVIEPGSSIFINPDDLVQPSGKLVVDK